MENTIKNLLNLTCLSIRITAPGYLMKDKSSTKLDSNGETTITRSNKLTTTSLIEHINNRL